MRALAIVHQDDTGPGVFAEAVDRTGGTLDTWRIATGETTADEPTSYDAVMTFGGAMHPDDEARHRWLAYEKELLRQLLAAGTPLLGVCLGAELLAEAAGGGTRKARTPEIGWHDVQVTDAAARDPLLAPLTPGFRALEWHSYECVLPPGATKLAHTDTCLQAFRIGDRRAWGIQFHAEVTATDFGAWLDDYRSDEDAVRMSLDADAFRKQTSDQIAAWNELGAALCERFLATATRA